MSILPWHFSSLEFHYFIYLLLWDLIWCYIYSLTCALFIYSLGNPPAVYYSHKPDPCITTVSSDQSKHIIPSMIFPLCSTTLTLITYFWASWLSILAGINNILPENVWEKLFLAAVLVLLESSIVILGFFFIWIICCLGFSFSFLSRRAYVLLIWILNNEKSKLNQVLCVSHLHSL